MFGRKRIAQLEESVADKERLFQIQQTGWLEANRKLAASLNQVEYLVRTIRDMDQHIFNMSQCTSWPQMQPIFLALQDQMTARKVAESNRISDIMRKELIATYKPSTKRIGTPHREESKPHRHEDTSHNLITNYDTSPIINYDSTPSSTPDSTPSIDPGGGSFGGGGASGDY